MITVRGTNIAQGVHGVSKEIDFRNAAAVIANTWHELLQYSAESQQNKTFLPHSRIYSVADWNICRLKAIPCMETQSFFFLFSQKLQKNTSNP